MVYNTKYVQCHYSAHHRLILDCVQCAGFPGLYLELRWPVRNYNYWICYVSMRIQPIVPHRSAIAHTEEETGEITSHPKAVILLPAHTSTGKFSFPYCFPFPKEYRYFYKLEITPPFFFYLRDMTYKCWRACLISWKFI